MHKTSKYRYDFSTIFNNLEQIKRKSTVKFITKKIDNTTLASNNILNLALEEDLGDEILNEKNTEVQLSYLLGAITGLANRLNPLRKQDCSTYIPPLLR